jgi:hypothetical protein
LSASRLPALGTALVAAACVTVTPAARSAAPINSCSSSQQCQDYAPGGASPSCDNGICVSSLPFANWTAVISLSADAAYGAGATFAVPFSTLITTQGTCTGGGGTCPPGKRCAPLPQLVSRPGELIVWPTGASLANWNLGNAPQNTVLPVRATFRPQAQSGSSLVDATTIGLPLGLVDAPDEVDTSLSAPPGPGGGPSLFFLYSLAPLPPGLVFERTLMPVAPFDQAFPPDIDLFDLSSASEDIVIYGCGQGTSNCALFDSISGSNGFTYPSFDLSRADGQPLDGWTAYLQDLTTLRRISNAVTLSGTMAKGVQLLTSRHRKQGDALGNAALVMQPPSGSSLPTAILQAVNGVLGTAEVYPQLPAPVPVSGAVTLDLPGGAPVAADVVFESVSLCRDYVSNGMTTVVLDPNPDLAFTTTATAANGSFSAVLPMGVYRATIRPYDTTAQVTVFPNVATTGLLPGQQCGAPTQPGPLVVAGRRTVRGTAMVADGRALADATIEAIPTACSDSTTDETCLPRAGGTTTANDGSFIMSLDQGGYSLRVRPAEGSALPWVVTPLAVGPSDMSADIPLVPAPTDAGFVLLDPVACNPIVEAVVRMYETPAMGSSYEVGEALTDSTGEYSMYLAPPAQ